MVELWRAGVAQATTSIEEARTVEAEGWDGQMFMDSASLSIDPYVAMGLWAGACKTLRLCTGVTNPHTRHLAVTASAISSVQALSGGRAVLGIGRGDSALAYLGLAPVSAARFDSAIRRLQTLLRREMVSFDDRPADGAASIDTLSLGAKPRGTSLLWAPSDMPKVPLDVAATGPRVIASSATVAERLTFSVGAMPERIGWALDIARAARSAAGMADDGISYGAQVLVFCHSDPEKAMDAAGRAAASLARFQVIQGDAAGPMSDNDRANFQAIRDCYDMTTHGVVEAKNRLMGIRLDDEFISRFAIAGTPDHCADRLVALMRMGVDRFVCVGPSFYPADWGDARHLFVREVIPALRAASARHAA